MSESRQIRSRDPLEAAPALPTAPAPEVPHAPGQVFTEERTRVAVGRGVNVAGRLIFQEPVRIEGNFRGEVSSADLVEISTGARVEGQVRAPRLLILGELRGDVIGAEKVVLGPRSRINGNIQARRLTVCEGAYLNGEVRMRAAPPAA